MSKKTINTKKQAFYASIGVAMVIIAALLFLFSGRTKAPVVSEPVIAADDVAVVADTRVERMIDGMLVEPEQQNNRLAAVVIENHWDARPQAGLAQAQMVIEAPVEGGITRFLAFFDPSQLVEKIGPVRSARPYLLDWARGNDAVFFHVGGSPDALSLIHSGVVPSVDQYFNDQYYWRTRARYAPHNVYTSTELIADALTQKKLDETPTYQQWKYKDDAPSNDVVSPIVINFSEPIFRVSYQYDAESNAYTRSVDGEVHSDDDGHTIVVKNVVTMVTDVAILDSIGRRSVRTIGSGDAMVFRDGVAMEGRWIKKTKDDRLSFVDMSGEPIVFNRGNTWIHVLANAKMLQLGTD